MTKTDEYHLRELILAQLAALEARPVFVAIEPRKYFRWLKKNGVTNTIGQRSVYAAEVYSGGTVSKGRVFEAEDL
jgi:hypothetical protein